MDCAPGFSKKQKLLTDIIEFVTKTRGLRFSPKGEQQISIRQEIDGKAICIHIDNLDDVLFRTDQTGADFIQINFVSGQKILLTDTLVGFKPECPRGVDLSRLPRVVTTPDVLNVFEAIQDALHAPATDLHEISVLKKVFEAVLKGGEDIGFDLAYERSWLIRIPAVITRASS